MPEKQLLLFQLDVTEVFYDRLHQHEELQVSYIESGEGKVIVADSIYPYKAGDLFIFGSNLPHVFISDSQSGVVSVMKTIFISPEILTGEFGKMPELKELSQFVVNATPGLRCKSVVSEVVQAINTFSSTSGLGKMIAFFQFLKHILEGEYEKLSHHSDHKNYTESEGKRMSAIMNYTIENYASQITLEQVAGIANLNKNAFCRYFKQRTRKTYFQFLIEVRIENACRELSRNTDRSIAEIAENCGFQNISNFNRKFRELKQVSPFNYRKEQLIQYKQFMN